jgi:predicted nucleotidyltransferase
LLPFIQHERTVKGDPETRIFTVHIMAGFDISLWEEGLRERREHNEALRRRTLARISSVLEALRQRYAWREIHVFGSVLQPGRFGPDSDLDFAVLGLPKGDLYRLVGELSDALQRRVDVVVLEETRMEEAVRRKGVRWEPGKELPFS